MAFHQSNTVCNLVNLLLIPSTPIQRMNFMIYHLSNDIIFSIGLTRRTKSTCRVYCVAQVLQNGIVLVDLPGMFSILVC